MAPAPNAGRHCTRVTVTPGGSSNVTQPVSAWPGPTVNCPPPKLAPSVTSLNDAGGSPVAACCYSSNTGIVAGLAGLPGNGELGGSDVVGHIHGCLVRVQCGLLSHLVQPDVIGGTGPAGSSERRTHRTGYRRAGQGRASGCRACRQGGPAGELRVVAGPGPMNETTSTVSPPRPTQQDSRQGYVSHQGT